MKMKTKNEKNQSLQVVKNSFNMVPILVFLFILLQIEVQAMCPNLTVDSKNFEMLNLDHAYATFKHKVNKLMNSPFFGEAIYRKHKIIKFCTDPHNQTIENMINMEFEEETKKFMVEFFRRKSILN